jgi:hypothetical protein
VIQRSDSSRARLLPADVMPKAFLVGAPVFPGDPGKAAAAPPAAPAAPAGGAP